MNKALKGFLLVKEIGIRPLVEYALYLAAKKSGQIAKQTPIGGLKPDFNLDDFDLEIPLPAPGREDLMRSGCDQAQIITAADEIVDGKYHPFSGPAKPLTFFTAPIQQHWLNYGDTLDGQDIKWQWEPARFSWALNLARAYRIQPDERYAECFWQKFETFIRENPVNLGPSWSSAQECAMRLMAWTMAFSVFKDSPISTKTRTRNLANALWQHAARIPPTLPYARGQNNNHLLSEALGLIIAGAIFKQVSLTSRNWLKQGIKEFNNGLLNQIESDGTYGQHSTNYHRLMMQLSLLYFGYANTLKINIPSRVTEKLGAATLWMAAQMDAISGRLPNLGHNDGSLLLPMGCADFRDYRPTLQAASLAFLGQTSLPSGPWDELSCWLRMPLHDSIQHKIDFISPAVYKIGSENTWASLRAVQFHGRPAHADQLHLELWRDGLNIAQDAGTYAYNDDPPWQNALSGTTVHNTIMVNKSDQMMRAGKFLWLKQANAKWLINRLPESLSACHNGYRQFGVVHQRTIWFENDHRLLVSDLIKRSGQGDPISVTLHWLLPDWEWELKGQTLSLSHNHLAFTLAVAAETLQPKESIVAVETSLIRGGIPIIGKLENPLLGWVSPTYGIKEPAISMSVNFKTSVDLQITSDWNFRTDGKG